MNPVNSGFIGIPFLQRNSYARDPAMDSGFLCVLDRIPFYGDSMNRIEARARLKELAMEYAVQGPGVVEISEDQENFRFTDKICNTDFWMIEMDGEWRLLKRTETRLF